MAILTERQTNAWFAGLLSLGCLMMVLLFIFGPFALIWAIGTLWGVPAVYTFKTWIAAEVMCIFFGKTACFKSNTCKA